MRPADLLSAVPRRDGVLFFLGTAFVVLYVALAAWLFVQAMHGRPLLAI
jgi:hypothetical protein